MTVPDDSAAPVQAVIAAAAAAPIQPASLERVKPPTTDGATGLESAFQEQFSVQR